MRIRWLLTAFVASTVLLLFDYWAVQNSIFWRFRWFDTPMHVVGGFALAVFIIGLLNTYKPLVFGVSLAVLFVGWEIFEHVAQVPQPNPYVLDTAHDLVNDVLGALFAFALARETIWRSK